jgi:hypothetical protein
VNHIEKGKGVDVIGARVMAGAMIAEMAKATGRYEVECFDKDGVLKWRDTIENVTCDQGVQAMLTAALKGSAFTAVNYMGLISNVSYVSVPVAANTMASHATWTEAVAGTCAARVAPTFGTAAARALATTAASFSIVGTDTIKGVFLAIKDAAGVAPTSAVANTSGAMWSAGLFSGGDKPVANLDTLNVTYSTGL